MTLQGYLDSCLFMTVPKLEGSGVDDECRRYGCDADMEFAESFGRRINYGNVPELEGLFARLGEYCGMLNGRGSYNKYGDSGRVYEFSAQFFFNWSGINYGGATMRMQKLMMLDGESVYGWNVPVMFLHIVAGGVQRDLPIYPGYAFWKGKLPDDDGWEVPLGDVGLRVVEKSEWDRDHEHFYFERYFSPVYIAYMRGGVNMLTGEQYLKWDSEESWMRRKADRFVRGVGEYGERYESWSADELRELTMEAMGYDMDEYRDNNWTDCLWE